MQAEPTKAYVYQPGRANEGERIFGVAGPGADNLRGKRFTRAEAEQEAQTINARKKIEANRGTLLSSWL